MKKFLFSALLIMGPTIAAGQYEFGDAFPGPDDICRLVLSAPEGDSELRIDAKVIVCPRGEPGAINDRLGSGFAILRVEDQRVFLGHDSLPLFENSVASNDLDFIQLHDASGLTCLTPGGVGVREMPSKLREGLLEADVRIFDASFVDSPNIQIWVSPIIGPDEKVALLVSAIAQGLGKLPPEMRQALHHVVLNSGNAAAQAEQDGGFFILYNENVETRMANHDLEETIFHEAGHVALDPQWRDSEAWQAAQAADGRFITNYAQRQPQQEDLAESALFGWALTQHPGRLPAEIEAQVRQIMPHRLALLGTIFDAMSFDAMSFDGMSFDGMSFDGTSLDAQTNQVAQCR